MEPQQIHTQEFSIRALDLDASGKTSITALIRLLENQRWLAFKNGGFARGFFDRVVIRAQIIELFEPVCFNQKLLISFWLSRVGRTSMDFSHSIQCRKTGNRIAQATVRIVALDSKGSTTPLPQEIHQFINSKKSIEIPKIQFDPQAEFGSWTHRIVVQWSDLDFMQHVNEARYVEYLENTRHACALESGLRDNSSRLLAPIQQLAISYEGQVREGEVLDITTWMIDKDSNRFAFEIRRKPDNSVMTRAIMQVNH